jgi:cation diffusion facilitator family transporter
VQPRAVKSAEVDAAWIAAAENARRGRRWIFFGLLANIVLATGKIFAGLAGRSQALLADGLESLLDVISSLMIWGALHVAGRPPDAEHPYGHGKVESLAGVFGALALVFAGGAVAWHNAALLFGVYFADTPVPPAPSWFTLPALVFVILLKEGLFRVLLRKGGEAGSSAMKADAWHHRSDAMTSAAAFIGILLALVGGPSFATADSWAALFSCAIIVFNGLRMMRGSVGEVIDEQGSAELVARILGATCAVSGVSSAEKCRVRKSGLTNIADLHVRVPGGVSVRDGHNIAHEVIRKLKEGGFNLSDVTVHIEPEPDSDHPDASSPGQVPPSKPGDS